MIRIPKYSVRTLMDDNKTVTGVNMGHLFGRLDFVVAAVRGFALAMYERAEIAPKVDKSFPFSQAAAAHHFIHDRKAIGKVVLIPD